MPAGKLRNKVVFQVETRVDDEGGGYEVSWDDDPNRQWFAEFIPERGRERIEAGRIAAPQGGILRVRWSSEMAAITEQNRVMIDDEPWNIRSVNNPDRKKKYIEMLVEKNVAT